MSKTKKRQAFAEEHVFSAQEFEASGIRELSFEELLEVNGGRQVKDDPRTDRNSDVCRSSGSSSRGSSSSGGSSSRGSSSGSYGSSSPSKGSSSSGSSGRGSSAHDSSSRRNTGSSKGSVSSGSASGSSSKSSQSSSFGETKPSNPSKPDRKEERSPTVGGGFSGNTSFGRNTGSSGGGGSFDRSSPSRDRDSSDRDSSRSDRYSSGSSVSSGSTVYTPPVQSQPVPASAAEKTTAPVQSQVQSEQNKNTSVSAPQNSAEPNRGEGKASIAGSVVPRVETAASARAGIAATGSSSSAVSVPPAQSQPAPASAAEKETVPVQSQVQEASVSSLQNSAEPNKGEESSPTQDGVAPQGEAAATVQNLEQVQCPIEKPLRQKFAETQASLLGTKYVYGAENPLNPQEGGVDCSGAVQYGLRTMGFMLPNRVNADTFLKKYTTEIERTEMGTGDLRGLQTEGGKFYHVQTLMNTYRVNPHGDETNTKNNPGVVEALASPLPASGVIRRLDENALNPYYDSSKDIVGGKLSVGQLDRAFSALLEYSN